METKKTNFFRQLVFIKHTESLCKAEFKKINQENEKIFPLYLHLNTTKQLINKGTELSFK